MGVVDDGGVAVVNSLRPKSLFHNGGELMIVYPRLSPTEIILWVESYYSWGVERFYACVVSNDPRNDLRVVTREEAYRFWEKR